MAGPDGLPYRYVPAKHDYGKSPVPKEGIVLHMAEGNRVLEYLAGGNVLRGVSATFICTIEGEIVQMLPLDHTSGSLNARDVRRSTDPKGRWGARYTKYYGPELYQGKANQLTISIECAGFAKDGPNKAQQAAIIELVERLRKRSKRTLGFNIHCDFADYKSCPGWSQGIRNIIDAVGHGREKDVVTPPDPDPDPDKPTYDEVVAQLEATKTKLEEAEDAIADAVGRLGQYVPQPNEPA